MTWVRPTHVRENRDGTRTYGCPGWLPEDSGWRSLDEADMQLLRVSDAVLVWDDDPDADAASIDGSTP